MKRLVVFCGSRSGNNRVYAEAARSLGLLLVERGISLVYGGGSCGLMGIIADTVMNAGGQVTGVITKQLNGSEIGMEGLTKLILVDTMHERKHIMAEMADGAIALPGAYGSHDELFEWLVWTQLEIHDKPFGLINTARYYDLLIAHADLMVSEGFLSPVIRALMLTGPDPVTTLDLMQEWRAARHKPEKYDII